MANTGTVAHPRDFDFRSIRMSSYAHRVLDAAEAAGRQVVLVDSPSQLVEAAVPSHAADPRASIPSVTTCRTEVSSRRLVYVGCATVSRPTIRKPTCGDATRTVW